jgi:hypothetical protein
VLLLALACTQPQPVRMILEVEAPGLSASEVELQVLLPLEADLAARSTRMEAWAWPGSGRLELELDERSAPEPPRTELPEGVRLELRVLRQPPQHASLVFTDPDPARARARAEDVSQQLRQTPCVHSAEVLGGQTGLKVTLDPTRLAAHGLTLSEVLDSLGSEPWDKAVIQGVPLVDLAQLERVTEAPWVRWDGESASLVQVLGQGCEDLTEVLTALDGELLLEGPGVRVTGPRGPALGELGEAVEPLGAEHQLLIWDDQRASLRVTGPDPGRLAAALQEAADRSPDAEARVHGGPRTELILQGEREALRLASELLRARLEQLLGPVDGGRVPLQPAVHVRADLKSAARYGVYTRDLTAASVPHRLEQGLVVLDGTWEQATVPSPAGPVPLTQLATIELLAEPSELYRADVQPALKLWVRTADRAAVQRALDDLELPEGVSVRLGEPG